MSANQLTVFLCSLLFYPESSDSPLPQFYLPFLSICLSLSNQQDDAKVKEEEEPAPLTQLAHSSTLEQEVLTWFVTVAYICRCTLVKMLPL